MVVPVIVNTPFVPPVEVTPAAPPGPFIVVHAVMTEFVTESEPVALNSWSNAPPNPSPAAELLLKPNWIVTPDIDAANGVEKFGLNDMILSMPFVEVVPAWMTVLADPLPTIVSAWAMSRSPVAFAFSLRPAIVSWNVPLTLKAIMSAPAAAFAAPMASRRLQSALQVPSFVSAVFVTVNVAATFGKTTAGAAPPWPRTTMPCRPSTLTRIGSTAVGAPVTSSSASVRASDANESSPSLEATVGAVSTWSFRPDGSRTTMSSVASVDMWPRTIVASPASRLAALFASWSDSATRHATGPPSVFAGAEVPSSIASRLATTSSCDIGRVSRSSRATTLTLPSAARTAISCRPSRSPTNSPMAIDRAWSGRLSRSASERSAPPRMIARSTPATTAMS